MRHGGPLASGVLQEMYLGKTRQRLELLEGPPELLALVRNSSTVSVNGREVPNLPALWDRLEREVARLDENVEGCIVHGDLCLANVLYDLRSSRAVDEYIREKGGIPVRERVGHSFMKATLRKVEGLFGGELAGHYYFRDNFHADCAIAAVIEVLNLLWHSGKRMSEVVAPLRRYAKSPETNFEVEDKAGKMKELEAAYADGRIDWLDGITVQYDDWWFNVRPSNTEPLLRLVVEARTPADLDRRLGELVARIGTPVHH